MQPAQHWLDRLREEDVPASLVREYADLADDEQAAANGYIVEYEHPRFGKEKTVGLHVELSETPGRLGSAAPLIGADTARVLEMARYSRDEVADLATRGIVALGSE
jgi:crotonobetainyl-CoA:carnitine CoA-transferase CaiB-like acyl-CoA transferase